MLRKEYEEMVEVLESKRITAEYEGIALKTILVHPDEDDDGVRVLLFGEYTLFDNFIMARDEPNAAEMIPISNIEAIALIRDFELNDFDEMEE